MTSSSGVKSALAIIGIVPGSLTISRSSAVVKATCKGPRLPIK